MENMLTNKLDELVGIEDALDFMKRGFTKLDHIMCYKPEYHLKAECDWNYALQFVIEYKTIRKATNEVARRLKLGLYMQS